MQLAKLRPGPQRDPNSKASLERVRAELLEIWLKERTVRTADYSVGVVPGRTRFGQLYDDYLYWLEDNAEKLASRFNITDINDYLLSPTSMGMMLNHRGIPNRTISGKSHRIGIALKEGLNDDK